MGAKLSGAATTGAGFRGRHNRRRTRRIVVLGLPGAGKSTTLHSLKLGPVVTDDALVRTEGLVVERLEFGDSVEFLAWTASSTASNRLRSLFRRLFSRADAVVWVVDAAHAASVDRVRQELHFTLHEEELRECPVLVLAHKQDVRGALSAAEITDRLNLPQLGQHWHVQPTCRGDTGGLYEGVDWLSAALAPRNGKYSLDADVEDDEPPCLATPFRAILGSQAAAGLMDGFAVVSRVVI
mmetsp:Transcript_27506/g.110204  ORF Transcript_27506/g.110204 Transcript_27506/m.110204 type:complete len:239 (+) Transcript_27506:439-1155(+)